MKPKRFRELQSSEVQILESNAGEEKKGLHIKAVVLNADTLTANNTYYPASVLKESVERLKTSNKLNESLGQGRLILSGEVEHPKDKGNKRPLLTETTFVWRDIYLNDLNQLIAEGNVIPTTNGNNLIALIESGVPIPFSIRGYGDSEKRDGKDVVTKLELTGVDASLTASDQNTGIITFESKNDMNEKLKKLQAAFPEMFKDKTAEVLESLTDDDVNLIEESIRSALKIPDGKDTFEFINDSKSTPKEESKEPPTPEIKKVEESAEDKKVKAQAKLSGMGFNSAAFNSIKLIDVFESETGQPAYTKASFALTESIVNADMTGALKFRDWSKPQTVNERFAAQYLKAFDANNREKLLAESKKFEEAQLTTDLALPISITRTIIEQANPMLVATSLFDTGFVEANDETVWFESFAAETGLVVVLGAAETLTAPTPAIGGFMQLANKRITPGTLVLKNNAENVTYTEGLEYAVDYEEGIIWILGVIANGAQPKATAYTYTAIRKTSELAPIERMKNTLTTAKFSVFADRLAMALSNDVVIFSKTQLGYDAYSRLLKNMVFAHAKLVDEGIFRAAISAVLRVTSNSGGTWDKTALEPTSGLIAKMGVAKVNVMNRYYTPTAYIMSLTNADALSKDATFTAANSRADNTLNANGFVGRINGLPVYMTSEMPNSYVLVITPELVMHRVLRSGTMTLKGPYQMYDTSTNPAKLLPGEEWYMQEYNGNHVFVKEKGSYVAVV